jgi:hypothetical protein
VAIAAQGKLPVFISWSLPLGEQIGSILRDWLNEVVPSIKPWFSGEDIETGKFWQLELLKSLDRSTVGIVIVTPASANRPWLNFEAGRLSSSIESGGGVVMPLLVNMELSDITGTPLSTLNTVTFNESGVWKIVKAIHERTGNDMSTSMLKNLFDLQWAELFNAVDDAIAKAVVTDTDNARPQRDTSVVLEDLIVTVNELRQEVRRVGNVAVGAWPLINEMAIYAEVDRLLEEIGVSPTNVQIVDVHSNGQIFLEVYFDSFLNEQLSSRIRRLLAREPKYAVQVKGRAASPPIVTTSTVGGPRVVVPPGPQDEPESPETPA